MKYLVLLISCGYELSEARIYLLAGGRIEASCCVHAGELRVVEGVVHLPSELQAHRLPNRE